MSKDNDSAKLAFVLAESDQQNHIEWTAFKSKLNAAARQKKINKVRRMPTFTPEVSRLHTSTQCSTPLRHAPCRSTRPNSEVAFVTAAAGSL